MEINKPEAIKNFFDGTQKQYIIPQYQRLYAWNKEQYETFFNDLKEQMNSENTYSLGRFLLEKENKNNNDFYIIDGQQRFTVITIFLRTIFREANKRKLELSNDETIDELERHYFPEKRQKLIPQDEDRDFYTKLICRGEINYMGETNVESPKNGSQKNMKDTLDGFQNLLAELSDEDVQKIYKKLADSSVYSIEMVGKKEATLLFELENNRGAALTNLEKIKAYLMYQVHIYAPADGINTILNEISTEVAHTFRYISEAMDEDVILNTAIRCHVVGSLIFENVLKTIKDKFKEQPIENRIQWIEKFFNNLKLTASHLRDFHLQHDFSDEMKFWYSSLVNLGINNYIYPFIVWGYTNFKEDKKALAKLFQLLEITIVRNRVKGNRDIIATNKNWRLDWIYNQIKDSFDINLLEKNLKNIFSNEPWYWGRRMLQENILNNEVKIYHSNLGIARYILLEYEKYLNKLNGGSYSKEIKGAISIEHIAPQTPEPKKYGLTALEYGYANEFDVQDSGGYTDGKKLHKLTQGGNIISFEESWLHHIGNLVLAASSHNTSLSNKPFQEKLLDYDKGSLDQQKELKQLANEGRWDRAAIKARRDKIMDFVLTRWLLPSELIEYQEEMKEYQEKKKLAESVYMELGKFKPSPLKESDEGDYYFDLGLEEVDKDEESTHIRILIFSSEDFQDYVIQAEFWFDRISGSEDEEAEEYQNVREIVRDNIDLDAEDGWGGIYPKEESDNFVQKLKQTIAKISDAGFEPLPS